MRACPHPVGGGVRRTAEQSQGPPRSWGALGKIASKNFLPHPLSAAEKGGEWSEWRVVTRNEVFTWYVEFECLRFDAPVAACWPDLNYSNF